jgi:hypothetical protein
VVCTALPYSARTICCVVSAIVATVMSVVSEMGDEATGRSVLNWNWTVAPLLVRFVASSSQASIQNSSGRSAKNARFSSASWLRDRDDI